MISRLGVVPARSHCTVKGGRINEKKTAKILYLNRLEGMKGKNKTLNTTVWYRFFAKFRVRSGALLGRKDNRLFFSSQKCSTSHSEFGKKSISYCGVKGFIFTFHTLQPVQIKSLSVLFISLIRLVCTVQCDLTGGVLWWQIMNRGQIAKEK